MPAHQSPDGDLRILFVPVSGPGGAGEYYRALSLAKVFHQRHPQAEILFAVDRHARYAASVPFPTRLLNDSPTRDVAAVIDCIHQFRPSLVLFDNAGRVSQLSAARKVGARTIYVSSRWKTRWKGFRLRRMRLLDQHWIVGPTITNPPLSPWERLKLKLFSQVRVVRLAVLAEPADGSEALRRFGLEPDRYLLVCPGGAGRFGEGPDAPQIFLQAARELKALAQLPILFVGTDESSDDGIQRVSSVANAELMRLLGDARLCVVNGGSLLLQAMASRAVCVAAPIAGDQPDRIRELAEREAIRAADLAVDSIVAAASGLLANESARAALRVNAARLGIDNGVEEAVAEICALLQIKSG